MVVVAGEKSGVTSGANQYWFRTFSACSNETQGVSITSFPPVLVMSANDGMLTDADELVALVTVTGSFEYPSNADFNSDAGSAIRKKTAVCSKKDKS